MIKSLFKKRILNFFFGLSLIPSLGFAYQPASQAEVDALNAAVDGDMRKAFLIMKEHIDRAVASDNQLVVKQGLDFLKNRDLIGAQAISDITIKKIRDLSCQKGFPAVIEEAAQQLNSKYAEVAPVRLLIEKRSIVAMIQEKFDRIPDQVCSSLEEDSIIALIQIKKELEIKRQQNVRDEEDRKEKEAKIKQAPQHMRTNWSNLEFCVNYGGFLKGQDFSKQLGEGKALENIFIAEAKRRNLNVDRVVVKKEIIRIGLNECTLYASWGEPDKVNNSVGRWGVHKQHVYGRGQYVYTENGRITSWQD
jgi:hypothetical protein